MGVEREVRVPNIGDFEDVDVIELLVAPGDKIAPEQSLLVLESDKATMEIPAPFSGIVKKLLVGIGDKVREGTPIALVEVEEQATPSLGAAAKGPASGAAGGGAARSEPQASEVHKDENEVSNRKDSAGSMPDESLRESTNPSESDLAPYSAEGTAPTAHAGPSVRRIARELGVDLALVPASGPKRRILADDVRGYVKALIAQRGATGAVPIAGVRVAAPVAIDFSKWGPVETTPLNRVRLVASANLSRSWVTVPHVTQFDEADVTELEAFRQQHRAEAERRGTKLTFLPFLVMAVTKALREFPHFNASLDHTGEQLVLKRYYHVGVAVDTEHGLVVPVLRDADQKTLFEIAAELQELSERARARRLRPEQLQGGTFSISSLGGIGGTKFTPIVNHPEVAILGVSKMEWKPVYQDGSFVPRRMLPLSLSYDHRVVDGAEAARFTTRLASLLADLRRILL